MKRSFQISALLFSVLFASAAIRGVCAAAHAEPPAGNDGDDAHPFSTVSTVEALVTTSASPPAAVSIAAPIAAASELTQDEAQNGKFRDDEFPVLVPSDSDFKEALEPKQGECAAQGSALSPWRRGVQEALGGQRFMLGVKTPGNANAPESTSNPARRACSIYRSVNNDNRELSCCLAGYRRGMPLLAEKIKRWIRQEDPTSHANHKLCLKEFDKGRRDAHTSCISCSMHPDKHEPVRYLGCFNLGFWLVMDKCDLDNDRKALIHQHLTTGGLYDGTEVRGFNDIPSRSSESSSPMSGGAQAQGPGI